MNCQELQEDLIVRDFSRLFSQPKWLIYTDRSPWHPEVPGWALVLHLVKDTKQLKVLWNKILIARGKTINEKP